MVDRQVIKCMLKDSHPRYSGFDDIQSYMTRCADMVTYSADMPRGTSTCRTCPTRNLIELESLICRLTVIKTEHVVGDTPPRVHCCTRHIKAMISNDSSDEQYHLKPKRNNTPCRPHARSAAPAWNHAEHGALCKSRALAPLSSAELQR